MEEGENWRRFCLEIGGSGEGEGRSNLPYENAKRGWSNKLGEQASTLAETIKERAATCKLATQRFLGWSQAS